MGLLCFPMRKAITSIRGKFVLPEEFKYSAALIIGVGSLSSTSIVQFKVRANSGGKIKDNPFNGYYGSLTFDEKGEVTISESVTREGATNRHFSSDLANRYVPNKPVVDIRRENEMFQKQLEQDRIKIDQLQKALSKANVSVS